MQKRCPRCQTRKAVTEFHKNSRQKDGLQTWCKTCVRTRQNQQRALNREAYRAYQREWFVRHPGYFQGYNREKEEPAHGTRIIWTDD